MKKKAVVFFVSPPDQKGVLCFHPSNLGILSGFNAAAQKQNDVSLLSQIGHAVNKRTSLFFDGSLQQQRRKKMQGHGLKVF